MGYHSYNSPAGSEQLCSNHLTGHSDLGPVVTGNGIILPSGISPQINLHSDY